MNSLVLFLVCTQISISIGFYLELNYPWLEDNGEEVETDDQKPSIGSSEQGEKEDTMKLFARLKKNDLLQLDENSGLVKENHNRCIHAIYRYVILRVPLYPLDVCGKLYI